MGQGGIQVAALPKERRDGITGEKEPSLYLFHRNQVRYKDRNKNADKGPSA